MSEETGHRTGNSCSCGILKRKSENITFKMNTTEANIKIIKNINSY